MIQQLGEADRAALTALLLNDPAHNLYMLGNLETLGFGRDFCQFWGQFDENGRLASVANIYTVGWSVYGRNGADWTELAGVIDKHPKKAERLQDNPGGVESILPFLRKYRAAEVHVEEVMELHRQDLRTIDDPTDVTIRRANLDDLDALVAFFSDAGHMTRSASGVERPLRDTRVWVADMGDEIVSTALTNAETASLAMIGGVFTPEPWRGRRLSQAVCHALCVDLIADDKMPVLYWDTPAAGAVYRKLGFNTVGKWRAVWLEAVA